MSFDRLRQLPTPHHYYRSTFIGQTILLLEPMYAFPVWAGRSLGQSVISPRSIDLLAGEMTGNRAQPLFMPGAGPIRLLENVYLWFQHGRAMMTMTTMREDRARPAGRLGIVCKCNQSTTRVSMYLMGLGTEELSHTSQIDWENEREGRT